MQPDFLRIEDVLRIHEDQIERYGGSPGLRDSGLLTSAVETPRAAFGGQVLHGDLFEMAAAYLFHIVQNHPFVDGKPSSARSKSTPLRSASSMGSSSMSHEVSDATLHAAAELALVGEDPQAHGVPEDIDNLSRRPHSAADQAAGPCGEALLGRPTLLVDPASDLARPHAGGGHLEDGLQPPGFAGVGHELLGLRVGVIPVRWRPRQPAAVRLERHSRIGQASGDQLSLELGERRDDVPEESPLGGGADPGLMDQAQLDARGFQLVEDEDGIPHRPRQTVQRHRVYMADASLADSLPQSLERRPIDAAARPALIIEPLANPIGVTIAEGAGAVEARLELGIAGREVLRRVHRLAGVDGEA